MELQQAQDDFMLYLEVEQNYSTNTLTSYDFDLKLYKEFLEKHQRSTDLDDLTPAITRRFIQDQVKNHGIKSRTIQRRISTLKSFSKFCLKNQYMKSDFMAGIVPPKSDSKLPIYMTIDELRQLFQFLEQDTHPLALRNHTMFRLLATTGMRRQELCDTKWGQIDFTQGTIKVVGKGKKERLLPLHSSVVPLLKELRASMKEHQQHGTEPIFLNGFGVPLSPKGLHKIFKTSLEKAGLPPHRFSLHHVRHTFATLLIQGTRGKFETVGVDTGLPNHPESKQYVDLRTLQELLGHASLSTTEVYTHVEFDQKKKAVDSFQL